MMRRCRAHTSTFFLAACLHCFFAIPLFNFLRGYLSGGQCSIFARAESRRYRAGIGAPRLGDSRPVGETGGAMDERVFAAGAGVDYFARGIFEGVVEPSSGGYNRGFGRPV